MPYKRRVLKTYGRYKFRTIKTDAWANSPVVCSPKDESSDLDCSIFRKPLATCTNLPKSQWNIPKTNRKETKASFRTSRTGSGKENITSSSSSSSSSPEHGVGSLSTEIVPETPPWAVSIDNDSPASSILQQSRHLSVRISPVSINSSTTSKGGGGISSSSFKQYCSPSETIDVPLQLSQERRRDMPSDLKRVPCVTSTPVIRANSRNSEFVTLQGGHACSRQRKCQVFVEHLKLTPEQYDAARSSMSDGDVSKGYLSTGDQSSLSTDSLYSPPLSESLQNANKSIGKAEKSLSTCPSSSPKLHVPTDYTDLITECVVSLDKLKLSPFKVNGRLNKKRLCVRVSLDNSSTSQPLLSFCDEDVSAPLSPPRNQTPHISFADAMTPYGSMKKETSVVELSAYQKLLLECEQEVPLSFKQYLKPSSLKKCVKIGEGVYGEVFRTINEYKQAVALKVIPIDGDFDVNGEPQKSCEEILHEIIISKELSELAYGTEKSSKWSAPNFISVHRVILIQDKYPAHLLKEWEKWDKRNDSENDKPDIFPSEQFFLVFEFANGGQDLEHFEFKSMSQALTVLQQITLSLAIAESSLEFEHRDLHWGNILIIHTDQEEIQYTVNGQIVTIKSFGVHVSIIDFTLSRLKKDGVIVFCNLSEDETLFTGQGDYQFDIYRQMRKINGDDWEAFTPATNVHWLHYLAGKIMKKKFPTRNRALQATLRRFFNQILEFQSAREITEHDQCFSSR